MISARREWIPASAGMILCSVLILASLACSRENKAAPETQSTVVLPASYDSSVNPDPNPPSINADRAMQYVKEIVAFGPRPVGSENHKKAEDYTVLSSSGCSGRWPLLPDSHRRSNTLTS